MKRCLIYCPYDQIFELKAILKDHNFPYNAEWKYEAFNFDDWTWSLEIEIWLEEIDILWLKLAIPDLIVR